MSDNRLKFGINLLGATSIITGGIIIAERLLFRNKRNLMDKQGIKYAISKKPEAELDDKEVGVTLSKEFKDTDKEGLIGKALFLEDSDEVVGYISRVEGNEFIVKMITEKI